VNRRGDSGTAARPIGQNVPLGSVLYGYGRFLFLHYLKTVTVGGGGTIRKPALAQSLKNPPAFNAPKFQFRVSCSVRCLVTEERYRALFYMPLYTCIYTNWLNVLAQIANKVGLQKKNLRSSVWLSRRPRSVPRYLHRATSAHLDRRAAFVCPPSSRAPSAAARPPVRVRAT
jgi:hypothetical protein